MHESFSLFWTKSIEKKNKNPDFFQSEFNFNNAGVKISEHCAYQISTLKI